MSLILLRPSAHSALPSQATVDAGAIYLGKLRLDGFVSPDAGRQGTVVSKPFALNGGCLRVNVEEQHGKLRAEVVLGEP